MSRHVYSFSIAVVIVLVCLFSLVSKFVGENLVHSVAPSCPTTNNNTGQASDAVAFARDSDGDKISARGAATGNRFRGLITRQLSLVEAEVVRSIVRKQNANPLTREVVRSAFTAAQHASAADNQAVKAQTQCNSWSVVTTIFNRNPAVLTQARLGSGEWCLVVSGDKKGPTEPLRYRHNLTTNQARRMSLLLYHEQKSLAREVPFVDGLFWNHFGRKNAGYLFAIAAGAERIWDFDDDNALLESVRKLDFETRWRTTLQIVDAPPAGKAFNPYPLLRPTVPATWPRGFPLTQILDNETWNRTLSLAPAGVRVGIWQSTANHDPDVDAIFRLTRRLPYDFTVDAESRAIAVPSGTFSPYNAQAEMADRSAFWSLYLPVTVNGRVSDIMRSYFAQRLFAYIGLHVAFTPPLVVQHRNAHDYLADFDAEQDLYYKTEQLLDFLHNWRCHSRSLPECIEELWVAAFEREYVDRQDVTNIQNWVLTLLALDYEFPPISGLK